MVSAPKRSAGLALFLLVLFLFSACTKKSLDNSLHLVMFENPKSLDPIQSQDALSAEAVGSVYETLLQYHYLRRPYQVVPLLSEGMPVYSPDGLTVTLKIKENVHFQDDPCFPEGKGRALVADDFIYSFKRLADPKNQSDGWWVLDGRIKGLNEWRANALSSGTANYASKIEGLITPNDHTLVIKFTRKYPQLNYAFAMSYTAPMAHEAIEKYGVEISNHPVGTGPFVLAEFVRSNHIIYEKNPHFHGEKFPEYEAQALPTRPGCDLPSETSGESSSSSGSMTSLKLLETCKPGNVSRGSPVTSGLPVTVPTVLAEMDYGKPLPLSDRIVVHIFLERSPAWLEFLRGDLDLIVLPKDNFQQAINARHELKSDLTFKGMMLSKDASTTEWFLGIYMEDPLLGKNKFLRKAIGYAYDSGKDIELFTNGLAKASNQILPPSIAGYNFKVPAREYNLDKAREMLVKAGFPGGKGLPVLHFDVEGSSQERQRGEFFKAQMEKVGIHIDVRMNSRPELFDRRKKGKLQIHQDGWIADYPDAENFMQLLYGPNKSPGSNNEAFQNSEFDNLYEKMAGMEPSPARQEIIDRMTQIVLEEEPWIPNWIATLYHVRQGWLKNYVYSDFAYNFYKYFRLDTSHKEELAKHF